VRLLDRLRLHGGILELPELAVKSDAVLRPERLHQVHALGEPGDVPVAGHAERRERPLLAASPDTDVDPAAAELVEACHALRQVHGAVQRRDEDHAAESQALRAGGGISHRLDRAELRSGAQD
jgi:hypothetical protein